jgi:hypothetical protein
MLTAKEKQTRASRPFSLNQTGTLSRRHLAHFLSAVDTLAAAVLFQPILMGKPRDATPDLEVDPLIP